MHLKKRASSVSTLVVPISFSVPQRDQGLPCQHRFFLPVSKLPSQTPLNNDGSSSRRPTVGCGEISVSEQRNAFTYPRKTEAAPATHKSSHGTNPAAPQPSLRLWGDHGQEALESAHVCVINATATGTEILKNLVLPGIGSFTIVDGNRVSGEDVGNNFFLQKSHIGQNRAQSATELLQELNSDVSGNFVEESPEKLLDNDPSFFNRFNLVVATQLPESTLLRLAELLWNSNVPLLVCRTYGLVGYMRVIIKEHTVVESHPDNMLEDLRLDKPFPELREHVQSYDLDHMDKKDHSHTPWIVIVAKYLTKWFNEKSDQLPKSYKEKEAFRQLIRQGILKNENGTPEDEENFEEAIKNVNTALNTTEIPRCIEEIFNDDCCINLTEQSPSFWILARAVKEFVANEGQGSLPVRGTIPDMIADSNKFIKLQNVYREKAKKDIAAVGNHAAKLLQSLGKAPESISERELKLLCSNSAFLRVVRCRSLSEEYGLNTFNKDEIISYMDNPDSEVVLYLMLRAVDRFYKQHGRYPGVYNYQVEDDIGKLKSCLTGFLQEHGLSVVVKDDYVHEFCRYGAAEPHAIAAFMGGKNITVFLRSMQTNQPALVHTCVKISTALITLYCQSKDPSQTVVKDTIRTKSFPLILQI
ncbi:PREDICTED: NEDD8-activating enzyme E1 regulatory subunit [Haliaeetus leucocephalus]|uniref:NEDD8-activating enzyme E1 regulatory subunit n=1 Tax=Haliaeetus leucocephalus TaxID=52644 RepID=UPI00053CB2B2|nr:PREDICTED: NEDD8-activating enzyme E1 regulatory subunit [Haliaeetus leucocephalus]